MPRLCRLLAAAVVAVTFGWLGLCLYVVATTRAERDLFAIFALVWLPVGALAARRVAWRLPRLRRAGWAVTAAVPAACAGYIAYRVGVLTLKPSGYAIVAGWAVVQCAGVVGLVLDGDPAPDWDDGE